MKFQYSILLLMFVFSQVLFSSIAKSSYQAIKTNNIKKVKSLIKRSNVNKLNEDKETIINYAIIKGNIKIVKHLIKLKAKLNIKSKVNYAFTIKNSKIINSIKITQDIGANGDTPLLLAIKTQNLELVKLLVKNGADVNFEKPNTPLKIAIKENNIDIVKFLLKKGAKLDLVYDSWVTPLFLAIDNNNIDIFNLLIQNGEKINKKNLKRTSPLGYALLSIEKNKLSNERLKMIKYLISKKAKINDRALYYATNSGSLKLVNLVISNGAKIDLKKEVNGESLIN